MDVGMGNGHRFYMEKCPNVYVFLVLGLYLGLFSTWGMLLQD